MGQGDNPAFADGMLQGDFLDRPAAGFQEVTRRIDMGAYMSENLQPGQHVRGELQVFIQFNAAAFKVILLYFPHAG